MKIYKTQIYRNAYRKHIYIFMWKCKRVHKKTESIKICKMCEKCILKIILENYVRFLMFEFVFWNLLLTSLPQSICYIS